MKELYINPHDLSCPWHGMAEQFGSPNIKWCEETLCSIISEPANTWSNLLYLLFGIYIFLKHRKSQTLELKAIGPLMFFMGACSFFYHMSNFYLSQIFDFLGMFLFLYWLIFINFRRLKLITKKNVFPLYLLLNVGTLVVLHSMYLYNLKFQLLIVLIALALLFTESLIFMRNRYNHPSYKDLFLSLILLSIAEVFSLLDGARIMCDPSNHFVQGHAIWHAIGAVGLYFSYVFYKKIDYKTLE